ncbi:MAG: hypothetical protein SGILL_001356, partial [Bacillariaceae sp.]
MEPDDDQDDTEEGQQPPPQALPGDELVGLPITSAHRRRQQHQPEEDQQGNSCLDHSTIHTDSTEDLARRLRPQGLHRSPRRQDPPPQQHRLQNKSSLSSPVPNGGVAASESRLLGGARASPHQEPGAYSVPRRTGGRLPAWSAAGGSSRQQRPPGAYAAGGSDMPSDLPLVTAAAQDGDNNGYENENMMIDDPRHLSESPPEHGIAGDTDVDIAMDGITTAAATTVTVTVSTAEQAAATVSQPPVDLSKAIIRSHKQKYSLWIVAGLILVLAIVGIVVGVLVAKKNQNDSQQRDGSSNPRRDALQEQLMYLTSDSVVADIFGDDETSSSLSSPQSLALSWLADVDPWQLPLSATQSELEARYALAVLYFATTGDEWNSDLNFLS